MAPWGFEGRVARNRPFVSTGGGRRDSTSVGMRVESYRWDVCVGSMSTTAFLRVGEALGDSCTRVQARQAFVLVTRKHLAACMYAMTSKLLCEASLQVSQRHGSCSSIYGHEPSIYTESCRQHCSCRVLDASRVLDVLHPRA